ncbi:TIGR00730 family Rossman fold protein [Ravibacter arvi]|uniref:Cytokinin riboside 5'-monophosphate phosphoribohydrolase n=1 Tax=Ravibacter arvi TaxID=2051041 RepID=A0ABP8MAS1_9BACT
MKSIAVYCASSFGAPLYTQVAYDVGKTLAQRNVRVIYGGSTAGLMGKVADAALENGGSVVGVIPDFLSKLELMHPGLSEIHVVETMHQRKAKMVALSEGILVLPGGYGTLDELFEVLAWSQLRIFNGPVGILNVNGFYDLLLAHLDRAREEQFLRSENRDLIRVDDNLEGLLMQMDKFVR